MFQNMRADRDVRSCIGNGQALVEIGLDPLVIFCEVDVRAVDIYVEADPARPFDRWNKTFDDPTIATDIDDGRGVIQPSDFFIDRAGEPPVPKCSNGISARVKFGRKRKVGPMRFVVLVDRIERLVNEPEARIVFLICWHDLEPEVE